MERRLSAILAADMVGYSRLMEADEIGTLERQKQFRTQLIDPFFETFHGRIVKEMGDGVLVEFPSVVEAVQCGVEIQRGMLQREADATDDQRIQYRIGINLGDIIIEGEDIFGDGVNIAARLEQLAEPGGICISGTAYDHLKSNIEVGYESLGEVQVKNIKKGIRAYKVLIDPDRVGKTIQKNRFGKFRRFAVMAAVLLLAVIGGGTWWWSQLPDFEPVDPAKMALSPPPKLPDKPSIAVMPFANMSNDKEQKYFADGMSEDIITDLSKLSGLFVISRNSSFRYRGDDIDLKQVGRELGVKYVLEGSVRRSGNKLRINVQLIDTQTGGHLWAERYDGNLQDVFALQDKVSASIVDALSLNLAPEEVARIENRDTSNVEAYEEFLKGQEFFANRTPQKLVIAIKHYEQALNHDPNFTRAAVALARSFQFVGERGWGNIGGLPSNPKAVELSKKYVKSALATNKGSADAHTINALNLYYVIPPNFDDGVVEARLGVMLDPNSATAHFGLAKIFVLGGEPEKGIEHLNMAKRLDPADVAEVEEVLAYAHFGLEDYRSALKHAQTAWSIAPKTSSLGYIVAASHSMLGDAGKAAIAMKRVNALRKVQLQPEFDKYRLRNTIQYWFFRNKKDEDRFKYALLKEGILK